MKTLKGFKEARKIIKEEKPDLVIGTGGYICGAVLTSAHKEKIPTALHESNAYPGLAVKLLAKKTDVIMVAFKETKDRLKMAKKVVVTGTPTKIKKIEIDREKLLKENGLKNDIPIVLIFGGSQGARKINMSILEILKEKLNNNYQIIWAPGKEQYEIIKEELEKVNININNVKNAKIMPYIYNMQEMMEISDLIVSRSGAMTVTEISILGKPAIFIPLPSISQNRQVDNAKVMENIDAARIILDENLNYEILTREISNLISDKDKLKKMGQNARKISVENAEQKIYEEIKNEF